MNKLKKYLILASNRFAAFDANTKKWGYIEAGSIIPFDIKIEDTMDHQIETPWYFSHKLPNDIIEISDKTVKKVLNNKKKIYCPYCGSKKDHTITTDINSNLVCKNRMCEANKITYGINDIEVLLLSFYNYIVENEYFHTIEQRKIKRINEFIKLNYNN